ncbi:MAG: mandelate racemase/muconate lactonizing enzyme family protein [Alphaproteobacteria bacterium]|jgi:D-arabinonate dehydratase|nr:mandelate racemase/muconate lactonizing enzyme family protein [Alphaproteobacteria bacterium]MDP6564280.1 mandelate racemase/muconate lactonizing enzyme family protein [Alphaproteobacteria bacterium]MDP6811853.1 mandelate racemase/muconate lactonizing enzyme family protein [Alphaproteobacteria bacterium]
MIVKDIRTTCLRIPFTDPPRWSVDYDRPRELLVVEIETASGLTGMGYLMPLAGGLRTIRACLEELIAPLVLGREITEVEAIWQDIWRGTYWLGRMGVTVFAQSAVDIALWDALGKRAGLPLHRLWGHARAEIPAYGSGCWRGLGGEGMVDKARAYVEQGFGAIKMQVGHMYDHATDLANVAAMRSALGDGVDIMVDVNMGWTADEAIAVGRRLDDHDIFWLEEPVVAEDFAGYFRIADALKTRVVGGESHFTRYDLRPFFETAKVPILQPDMMRGGLSELRKIAVLADTAGLQIAPHLFHELMVQVMAAIPNGQMLEYLDFLDDLWLEPVLPEGGVIRAPERPGHGLAFKPEVLKDFAVEG